MVAHFLGKERTVKGGRRYYVIRKAAQTVSQTAVIDRWSPVRRITLFFVKDVEVV